MICKNLLILGFMYKGFKNKLNDNIYEIDESLQDIKKATFKCF